MSKSITIDNVHYKTRTAAARALVAAGKTIAEAAKATGLTYQTVYANTTGAEKVNKRRLKYRVLAMGKTGKRTVNEIAKKTGLTVSAVVALLKKNNIPTVTIKESKSAAKTSRSSNTLKTSNVRTPKVNIKEDNTGEIPTNVDVEVEPKA